MELHQLRYFQKIAEYGNITKAAAELKVTQPCLSRALKSLEAELGTELFRREGRRLILNENGNLFLEYTRQALETISSAADMMKERSAVSYAPLNIATIHDNGLLPSMLSAFHEAYPYIQLHLHHFYSPKHIPAECTIIIHSSEEVIGLNPFYKTELLLMEECMIGLSKAHPLAGCDELDVQDLAGEPFIVLSQDNSFGEFSRSFYRMLGIKPRIAVECDNLFTIDILVAKGTGLSLYPSQTWTPDPDRVVLRRIREHKLFQPLYLSAAAKKPDPGTQLFYSFAVSYFHNHA